jgi:hypothetical protein
MSNDNNKPVNASELLRALSVTGRIYTDTRNVVVAHLLIHGVKPDTIKKEGDVSGPEVSRIARIVKGLSTKSTLYKSTRDLSLAAVRDAMGDPLSPFLANTAKMGEGFRATARKSGDKGAGAPKLPLADSGTVRTAGIDPTTGKPTGRAADRDITEVIFEWVTADFATRGPVLAKLLSDAEAYVATNTARADAAA